MGIVHYFFPWILIHLVYFQESESYSSQINSNTLVGKPQLGMMPIIGSFVNIKFLRTSAMLIVTGKGRRRKDYNVGKSAAFQSRMIKKLRN